MPETGQRTSALGGMGLGIAQASPNREAAWDYAWFVMSRDVQGGIYLRSGGQPGRRSALKNPIINAGHAGFGSTLVRALDGCYIRPRYPGWRQVELRSNAIIGEFLAGQLTELQTIDQLDRAVRSSIGTDW